MHADVAETKRLNEYFMGLLANNCGFKSYSDIRKLIKEQDGRDRYMTAKQAMEFGIVDAIGMPKISASMSYEISIAPQKPKINSKKHSPPVKQSKPKRKPDSKK
jgi:hypothetical protein